MNSISIDVKLISGKDLKAFNFFQKLTIYAQVSISSDDPDKKLDPDQKQRQRSPTDRENDGNPEWNHQMRFQFDPNQDLDHLFLQFDFFHEGAMFGDKQIGEVRVAINDLIRDSGVIVRFVSYQVRSPDEKPNGVLDFNFKVNGSYRAEMGTDFPVTSVSGFPAAQNHIHLHNHHHEPLYPQVEVDHGGPPLIHYPPSTASPYSSQVGYYPPPESYYPPPPPPATYYPPQPSPTVDGAHYGAPRPHGLHHWGSSPHLGGYDYGAQGSPRPGSGQFEAWPGGWYHSSSWNGR